MLDIASILDDQGIATTALAHCHLQLGGFWARCDAVGVESVQMPGQIDRRGPGPAAHAAYGLAIPLGGPQDQPSRVLR